MKQRKQKSLINLSKWTKAGLTVLISVLIISAIIKAGDINPPGGEPTAQFYTLSQIYDFIVNNTPATEGSHDFTFSDELDSTHHTLAEIYDALASLISADQVKLGTTYLGVTGTYECGGSTYTWTKEGSGSWEGILEDLDWAKEIGGVQYWDNVCFSYCQSSDCSVGGTCQPADGYGPPGGWNGSFVATFNNSALHNYEVITTDGTNLGDCIADTGDLVFPDGSVWDKSNTKPYSDKLAGCSTNDSNAAAIWSAAGGSGLQYANAANAPSALSIADAWDGKKNLVSGPSGTYTYTNNGISDDYYDRPAVSWYADEGDGVGTSRMPMVEEYEWARQGTPETATALLYGTVNSSEWQWVAEQYPSGSQYGRIFIPSSGRVSYDWVNDQAYRMWVVVAQ